MLEYVSKCYLLINGQEEVHFKSFKEMEREVRAQVPLMHTTGFTRKTVRHVVEVEYAVPTTGKRDWEAIEGATLVVEDDGGDRTLYTGVATLKVGEVTRDGDNAAMQTITLGASDRKLE